MEKRLPLALFLMFLVFFGWTLLFPHPEKPRPTLPQESGVPPALPSDAATSLSPAPEESAPAVADTEERELELFVGEQSPAGPIRPGAYRARFSNRGARLLELDLADYVRHVGLDERQRKDPSNWLPLIDTRSTPAGETGSLLWKTSASSRELAPADLDQVLWQMEELGPEKGVLFRYAPPGKRVVFEKRVTFEPGTWRMRVALSIENLAAGPAGARDFVLVPAGVVPPELADRFYSEPNAVAIGRGTGPGEYELDSESAPALDAPGALEVPLPVVLGGVHNKYFAFLLRDAAPEQTTLGGANIVPLADTASGTPLIQVELPLKLALPAEGETRTYEYVVYAGPKAPVEFVADFAPHQLVLDDDLSVDSIAKALLYVLRVINSLVGNWGVAIILLTLGVRLALFPLNRRSQTAMARYQKKMKRVQPRLEEIKKRFENDPQKLREAQARIMQEEGAFPPLGGCLPVFLQMPVFFGLFSALRTSFDLRQAPFYGWIHDLSRPDRLLHVGIELPLLPDVEYLNVLPLLMVVVWVLQQMGMPKPADEQAARMQKMMLFMPVVFGVMLYNYAAGLSLYMITTSTLSIVEQKVIKKLWPIDDTEQERKAKAGCGPFSGALQHMADKHASQMKRVQAMQAEQRRQKRKK